MLSLLMPITNAFSNGANYKPGTETLGTIVTLDTSSINCKLTQVTVKTYPDNIMRHVNFKFEGSVTDGCSEIEYNTPDKAHNRYDVAATCKPTTSVLAV